MAKTLSDLVAEIIADGTVDAAEVTSLRAAVLEDGVIDRAECDAMFEINDACADAENDAGWSTLFVESVTSHIMEDGVIDNEETQYLVAKIEGDGKVCGTELALLENLQSLAGDNFPAELAALMS